MVKILLIQLDRFGDNLFIVPLIKGLKIKYPGCHITVLVRDELREILQSYREVDCLERATWLNMPAEMAGLDESDIIIQGYTRLMKVVDDLRGRGFDKVYNLNFNKLTTLLTSLLNVPDTTGFTVNRDGEREINGQWVNYMGCMVRNRGNNPYHMVDVYRNFEPGLPTSDISGFIVERSAEDYASRLLKDAGIEGDAPVIAFQPGASNRKRIWPAQNFSRLAEMISGMGIRVILLGARGEEDLAAEIAAGHLNVLDLTGKTTFQQLAAILGRCRLLISNDTGTVHLASAIGVTVIGLYMCHAYPIETGPYGRGHLSISPVMDCFPCNWKEMCSHDQKCLEYITPEDVCSVLKLALLPHESMININGDIDIDISVFDDDGFISYMPYLQRKLKPLDIIQISYKRMWHDVFNSPERAYNPAMDIRWLSETYDIGDIDVLRKEIDNIISIVQRVESLARKGYVKTEEILGHLFSSGRIDQGMVQSGIDELNSIIEMIQQTGRESEPLRGVTTFFEMQRDNSQGTNSVQALRDTGKACMSLELHSARLHSIVSSISGGIR